MLAIDSMARIPYLVLKIHFMASLFILFISFSSWLYSFLGLTNFAIGVAYSMVGLMNVLYIAILIVSGHCELAVVFLIEFKVALNLLLHFASVLLALIPSLVMTS